MHAYPLFRRVTAWAMLALYGLVASGLPLPVGAPPAGSSAASKIAGKDRSQPFPCMDKACGCDTAERCLTNCCCHTPAETLAWAKARGIEASVIDALTRRVAASAPRAVPQASTCCAPKAAKAAEPSCCSADSDDVDNAICSDYQSLADEPRATLPGEAVTNEPEKPSDEGGPASRVVILRAMLACGGIVAQWTAMGISLPPPPIVEMFLSERCPQSLVVVNDTPGPLVTEPAVPPPRGC